MQLELYRQTGLGLRPEKRPLIVTFGEKGTVFAARNRRGYHRDAVPIDSTFASELLGATILKECAYTGVLPLAYKDRQARGYATRNKKGTVNQCGDCGFKSDDSTQKHPAEGREIVINNSLSLNWETLHNDPIGWNPEQWQLVPDEHPGVLAVIFKGLGGVLTYNKLEAAFPDRTVYVDTPTTYAVAYRVDQPEDSHEA